MKFLIFNIVVAVALVHLFTGDVTRVGALVDRAVAAVQPQSQPVSATPAVANLAPPAQTQPISQVKEAQPALPALADPVTVTKPIVQSPPVNGGPQEAVVEPAIAERRDEVLWGTAAPDFSADDDAAPFPDVFIDDEPETPQSSADRRQALLTLAEEMELFSLDQLNP